MLKQKILKPTNKIVQIYTNSYEFLIVLNNTQLLQNTHTND